MVALLICGVVSVFSIDRMQGYARVINYAGIVRGATQQLAKEELNGQPNDALIGKLDAILAGLQGGENEYDLSRMDSGEFQALLEEMQAAWAGMKREIRQVRAGGGGDALFADSEDYFNLANRAVHAAEEYTAEKVQQTEQGLLLLILLIVAAAVLLMWYGTVQSRRREKLQAEEDEYLRKKEYLDRMSESLRAPMNDISELLYISDVENYELLFLNEAGKRTFGVTGDFSGQKCYKVVQGMDEPCAFCNNSKLKMGENYTWEHTNTLTGAHYLLKDRLVEWDGRIARMELAFDMSEAERRKQSLQRALDVEKMLVDCVRTLYQNTEFPIAVSHMLKQLGAFLSAGRTYIMVLEEDGYLHRQFEWCADGVESGMHTSQVTPHVVVERWLPHFQKDECMVIGDVARLQEESPEEFELLRRQNVSRLVAAPLEMDGKLVGFLGVDNPPLDRLEHIAPLFQTLCYFIILAWQRSESEQELSMLSYYDTLTKFYNRNRYTQDTEALRCADGPVGVIYLDVNGLKDINDLQGHAFGDKVLVRCADMMREVFEGAAFYRIGGDEFVIISTGTGKAEFDARARELRHRLQMDEQCNAAIGARWEESTANLQQVIAEADAEMYEDKKSFYRQNPMSNRYRHANDELLRLADPKVLRQEILNKQFVVYLQPKVSSSDESTQGAEALIRYRPRPDTLVLPGNFLPMLEERRVVSQLDFYVFEFVCSKMREWAEEGKQACPVSVNFSCCSLAQPGFVKKLEAICGKYGISKQQLEIEITERGRNKDDVDFRGVIGQLRAAGFVVSIDGFGIETSNMTLLSAVEFDVLKLDKSMIDDVDSNLRTRAVIESIAGICRKMGIKLVAKGIESKQQLVALRESGVELAQGFLFSRPIPIEEYETEYLKRKAGDAPLGT